jgi:predicted ATPase/DNA-binding SARP family transcriptional activator
MERLALSLLGPLRVMHNDQPVSSFGYAKVRALLAYLAVEDRPHGRDALAAFLWPAQPAAAARSSLRVALTTLRRALGDQANPVPFLIVMRDSVQINPVSAIRLDVTLFTDLLHPSVLHIHSAGTLCPACVARVTEAVSLYRGDFLQQLEVRDSAAFEEWVTLWRERLHREALDALAALAAYHEINGGDDLARQYAWRTLTLEPWDEAAHRCVMRVLAHKGQRRAALAQYVRCQKVLANELGTVPAVETTTLYEQIRTGALTGAHNSRSANTEVINLPFVQMDVSNSSSGIHASTRPIGIASPAAPQAPANSRYVDPPLTQRHNLPPQLTAFIGREAELAKLADLLANPACRLLTIVGTGGVGKTRLALQASSAQIGLYSHGIYFVPLASTISADFLVSAIADSLGFTFNGVQAPQVQILNYLREKELLLVLDNFEHLVDGGRLVAEILVSAPAVKMLVTSRERLKLHGEWVYEIQGLAIPEANTIHNLEAYSAIQMFVQSARRSYVDFALLEGTKTAVIRLCQLVEGMPLGLELAASWVRLLSCEDIVQELAQNLDFLTTSAQNVPERHRSLRAVFDQSWNLLSIEERAVFQRLSIFQGGFRRDAAEPVAGARLPILLALVDKSLLRWHSDGRYELHELLRQYAAEKLKAVPEEQAAVHDRHADYYLEFLRQQDQRLKSSQAQQALAEIRMEVDNVRVACRHVIDQRCAEKLGPATQTFWLFYDAQGWYHEAEVLFRQAAQTLSNERDVSSREAASTEAHAQEQSGLKQAQGIALGQILGQQGWFLLHLGLIGKSRELFQQSVTLLRHFGARPELADILQAFSMAAWVSGNYREAQLILQECLTIFREQGSIWGIATCLLCLGNVAGLLGNYTESKDLLLQALTLSKEIGEPKQATLILNYLGLVAHTLGEYTEAKQWLQQSFMLSRELGDRWSMIVCLNHLGAITYLSGAAEWSESKRLHEESLALAKELGNRREIAVSLNYLGYVTCALAEYGASKKHFLDALHVAIQAQLTPVALDALVGLAILLTHQPAVEAASNRVNTKQRAAEILALVISNSASSHEVKEKAQRLLAEIEAELPLLQLAVAQERGQAANLEEVVAEILAEMATLDAPH